MKTSLYSFSLTKNCQPYVADYPVCGILTADVHDNTGHDRIYPYRTCLWQNGSCITLSSRSSDSQGRAFLYMPISFYIEYANPRTICAIMKR